MSTDLIWRIHDANRKPMTVYEFEYVDGLHGKCRGLGPIGDDLENSEDPIGIWDGDGTATTDPAPGRRGTALPARRSVCVRVLFE